MKLTAICKNCGMVNALDIETVNINKSNEEGNIIATNISCSKCSKGEYILIAAEDIAAVKALLSEKVEPEEHPVFGTDTPDSIREDVDRVLNEIQIDPGKIKGAVVNVGTRIITAVASIPDEDINNLVAGYKTLAKSYGEIVIALMPFIDKAYKVVTEIEKDFKKS